MKCQTKEVHTNNMNIQSYARSSETEYLKFVSLFGGEQRLLFIERSTVIRAVEHNP